MRHFIPDSVKHAESVLSTTMGSPEDDMGGVAGGEESPTLPLLL